MHVPNKLPKAIRNLYVFIEISKVEFAQFWDLEKNNFRETNPRPLPPKGRIVPINTKKVISCQYFKLYVR
jgi:hypothetical protein